ncbi:hypothetical protein Tco_0275045, partial [Tanacetum coccineum]
AVKAVFENLEAEVDQNEIDLKSGKIERKTFSLQMRTYLLNACPNMCFILELIQSRGCMIHELKEKISRLTEKNSDADPTLDLKALVSLNKDLTAKLNALYDLNERFRAENAKVKQHYKELYDSIKITRAVGSLFLNETLIYCQLCGI